MFYLLTADPSGQFGDARSTALVRQATRGTIAHEFQHMINQGIRQFNDNSDPFEVDWLNEGLAHFAEEAVGRASRQFTTSRACRPPMCAQTPMTTTRISRRTLHGSRRISLAPTRRRPSVRPRTSSSRRAGPRGRCSVMRPTSSPRECADLLPRPRCWPDFERHEPRAEAGVPFDQILSGWMIANYSDNLGIAGLDARYSYTSWNMRDASPARRAAPIRSG
jgi:hypothetical protein